MLQRPPGPMPDPAWFTRDTDALLAALEATSKGLTAREADSRSSRGGPNVLTKQREWPTVLRFLSRFTNPLLLVLLAAAGVSAVLGDVTSFGLIVSIVALSVTLDFVQEHRAGRAAEALQRSVAVKARVLRNGRPAVAAVARLVPGDVILLAAGSVVPADARVLSSENLLVDQAALTGEAFPLEKGAAGRFPRDPDALLQPDAVFMGSTVVSGQAQALVCAIGDHTVLGQVAQDLVREPEPTAFERGTRQFGAMLMRWTIGLVLFTLLVTLVQQRPPLSAFLFAIALAVGLTPELLPMIVSVTLARGATRLARSHVIVKRLSAMQDLGAMDVLCTDKTGTLTEARVTLADSIDALGAPDRAAFGWACINSRFASGVRSPLDEAILAQAHDASAGWRRVGELPFDFVRRRVSVAVERDGGRLLVVKGAPEEVLRLCTTCQRAGKPEPMSPADLAATRRLVDDRGAQGQRVLAVATRPLPPAGALSPGDERELMLVGLLTFVDPPKVSAGKTIRELLALGVRAKIVTGDNEAVTRHLCEQLGLPVTGVSLGSDIEAMDDAALRTAVERCNVFCRVSPSQKARIVQALRSRGHVVGFMGDGINDAPSLQAADVGISVDDAVDVAKQAADLILLRHSLEVLHRGILEGRRTFINVMKYIRMATSSNFGNMVSMAVASVFLPFLPMTSVQILLNNLLYDLSELALPTDEVDRTDLHAPQHWDLAGIKRYMLTFGPLSSLFDLATFGLLLFVAGAQEAAFQSAWFIESIATQTLVVFIVRTALRPWQSRPSRWLVLSTLVPVACAVALPYSPAAPALGFVPLPAWLLGAIFAIAAAYLCCAEALKQGLARQSLQGRVRVSRISTR